MNLKPAEKHITRLYTGPVPAWVDRITYRLSKTGRSVVIDIHGKMDLRSQMPGGRKRIYVTTPEFDLNPHGTINSVMHGAWSVQTRFYASCAVWNAREVLDGDERMALDKKLKDAGLTLYKDPEATSMIGAEIRRIVDERKSVATTVQ